MQTSIPLIPGYVCTSVHSMYFSVKQYKRSMENVNGRCLTLSVEVGWLVCAVLNLERSRRGGSAPRKPAPALRTCTAPQLRYIRTAERDGFPAIHSSTCQEHQRPPHTRNSLASFLQPHQTGTRSSFIPRLFFVTVDLPPDAAHIATRQGSFTDRPSIHSLASRARRSGFNSVSRRILNLDFNFDFDSDPPTQRHHTLHNALSSQPHFLTSSLYACATIE